MPLDIPLSCTCRAVTGLVRGVTWANSRRLSCMCDDCQVYAEYLGRAHELLDAHGGTELSYATQSRVEIATGRERLRAVRLYAKGILRVYAECCNTPVAHVPSATMAFVGIPHLFMRGGPGGLTRDAVLGPRVYRFQARYCRGAMPEGSHPATPLGPAARAMLSVAWDSLCGRHRPSAFHDAASGEPLMPVTVLSSTEWARLRGRWASVAELSAPPGVPHGCS